MTVGVAEQTHSTRHKAKHASNRDRDERKGSWGGWRRIIINKNRGIKNTRNARHTRDNYLVEETCYLLGLHQLMRLQVLRLILGLLLRKPLNICLYVVQAHIHVGNDLLELDWIRAGG